MEGKKIIRKRINKKNRKRNLLKSKKILFAMGITLIALVVATYAWFIGITTVTVDPFEVEVMTTEGLQISLDADPDHWETVLHVDKGIIEGTSNMIIHGDPSNVKLIDTTTPASSSYPAPNNVNHWATAGEANQDHKGLEPVSSSGQLVDTGQNASQAKFYSKTTLTSEAGGFRLAAGDITSPTATGYIAFDIFIKNASGSSYSATYSKDNDEALFLTGNSEVQYNTAGVAGDGIQNSVRVGFYALGRVSAIDSNITKSTIQGISCTASSPVTPLCNLQEGASGSQTVVPRGYNWNIWEPNDTAHTLAAYTRFNNACIKRDSSTGEFLLNANDNKCRPAGALENEALADNKYIKTYTINNTIAASNTPPISNIYDGLNGWSNPNMQYVQTLTDTENSVEATRNPLLYLAPASITKIRVYIYLEGQDVDNFDLASVYQPLSIKFGFTKDRYEVAPSVSPSASSSASPSEEPGGNEGGGE